MSTEETAALLNLGVLVFSYSLGFLAYKNRENKRLRSITDQPPWRILAVLMMAVGTGAAIVGIIAYQQHKVPSTYTYAEGTVTAIKQEHYVVYSGNCGKSPCISAHDRYRNIGMVSFVTNKMVYNFDENLGSAQYHVNQKVRVAYNPANPANNPKDTSNHSDDGVGQMASIIGFIFSVTGSVILYVGRKR